MAILKLAPNVPVTMAVNYADIVGGQYGDQVRLKGTVNGEDAMVFLHVDIANDLKFLGFTIGDKTDKGIPLTPPRKGYVLTVCKVQNAGDKSPRTVVEAEGENIPAPASEIPKPVKMQASAVAAPAALPKPARANEDVEEWAGIARLVYVKLSELLDDTGMTFTAQDLIAATATLYIQRHKH